MDFHGLVAVFERWATTGEGPTGWLPGTEPIDGVTNWSIEASSEMCRGCTILNEAAARGKRTVIGSSMSAFHLHVDDGVFVAHTGRVADLLMNATANELENIGFTVKDRTHSAAMKRIVGYSKIPNKLGLRFPLEKSVKLQLAMNWRCACEVVFVDVVGSLLGVWLFGALLRRDLLSTAQHTFTFVERHRGQRVRWWYTARKKSQLWRR